MTKKVCIVSPDLIGPVKNGGIGTHCYYLAIELKKASYNVSILFTGPFINKDYKYWERYYRKLGINFYSVDKLHADKYNLYTNKCDFLDKSYYIYDFLRNRSFDFIHFQDWMANGLVSIQSKQTYQAFQSTIITVTLHSSTLWQQEGMHTYSTNPLYDMKLKWAEQYCVEHCDIAISPSKYMFQWAKNANWKLPLETRIMPYCWELRDGNSSYSSTNIQHLIFFGRLETRKGLEYFISNIPKLKNIRKISFLGKISLTSDGTAEQYIANNIRNISYKIFDNFDSFQAINYIKENNGLVIIPSLVDNYPYTVIEMIQNQIPFLCSNVGGIPEMVDHRVLFDISDKFGLASAYNKLENDYFDDIQHKYNPSVSSNNWVDFHQTEFPVSSDDVNHHTSLVSICIPYYNYPRYLPLLLASLKNLTYNNIEVIIVNDGSSQKEAINVFEKMKLKYPNFEFYSKQNSGVGDTRNYAASKASGEYLIFMDSDNIAYPNMVDDFINAIKKSNSDIVTCYFDAFDEKCTEFEPKNALYKYLPLGACKEAGILENIYGDANFIIKRQVFNEVGGFGTERHTSWEDWELLAKCALEGYSQSVVPKSLFGYRHTEMGFSRNTSLYDNHQRIMKCYSNYYPIEIQHLISGYVLPLFYHVSISKRLYLKFKNKIGFFFPENSKRREFLKLMIKRILK